MEVRIQTHIRRTPLHDRDRSALSRAGAPDVAQRAAVEAEHGVDEDPADRAEQLAVVGEPGSKLERHGEHELPERHARQNVVHQVGGGLCHAPARARRTESAALAGKGDELLLAALGVLALHDGEASRKHSARDVTFEFVAHE
jgi:hypothetical protein